jgi:UDP-3-O-[3-hydroxymyristoyl] glucosamine N-acyltransferase
VRFGLGLRGEPSLRVSRVATLSHAGAGSLSFLANPRYRKQMESTRATAVLVGPEHAAGCPVAALIDPNPYLAYARIAELLHPQAPPVAGIHPTAVVSVSARIAASASVGPLAIIEDDVDIGERVVVGPGCIVQQGVHVGADSRLVSRVNLYAGVRIGQRCILHAGAVVGADGFGFAPDAGTWVKVPQVGSVKIGDDVEIGANTTIDRGAIDDTVVEHGVKLDNQIQVGHNVTIGAHTAIAGCVGISGSTPIMHR